LKSHGQALEQECCFPGVLCDGDTSADLLCQIYGHVMLRTRCLDSKRVEDMVLVSLAYLSILFCAALSAAAPGLTTSFTIITTTTNVKYEPIYYAAAQNFLVGRDWYGTSVL